MGVQNLDTLVTRALDFGFSHAVYMDVDTLEPQESLRSSCEENICGEYNRTWRCPPARGTVSETTAEIRKYKDGIIVQKTYELENKLDWHGMQAASTDFYHVFLEFRRDIAQDYPGMLALGSGGCKVCKTCTYPSAPCRHPEDGMYSMSGSCLVVSNVCRDNNIPYYYGENTITYVGCFLIQ